MPGGGGGVGTTTLNGMVIGVRLRLFRTHGHSLRAKREKKVGASGESRSK